MSWAGFLIIDKQPNILQSLAIKSPFWYAASNGYSERKYLEKSGKNPLVAGFIFVIESLLALVIRLI